MNTSLELTSRRATRRRLHALTSFARQRPITTAFIALALCLALRVNDIFVLKIDELWGEIIVSKALGFLVVLGVLAVLGERSAGIGLGRRRILQCMTIGAALTIFIYLAAYGIEFFVAASAGQQPSLVLSAIDSKQGVGGGLLFAAWLVLGNVINALMEEGLFRGVFLPALMRRFSFWKANTIQAALFAVWHLVWPLKDFLTGESSAMGALMTGLLLLIGSFVNGLFWGYLFYRTDSLWAPIAAHIVANSIQNLVHIQSTDGLDAMISLRGTVAGVLGACALVAVALIARRMNFARLAPLTFGAQDRQVSA